MKLKDIMTPNAEVVSVGAPIRDIAQKMAALDVGFIPLSDGNGVIGVVTDRDITIRSVAQGHDPTATPIRDIMTPDVISVDEDADVADAVKLMEEKQVRRIVVTNREGKCVGVASLGDLAVKCHDEELSGEALEEISKPSQPHR